MIKMIKKCSICSVEKSISEFHRKSSSSDGYRSNCKKCSSDYNRNRKNIMKEYNKDYRNKNKEVLKEKKKKYYNDNVEYFRVKNKEIRDKLDPKKKSEYSKKYEDKESTKEKRRKRVKERMTNDPFYKLKSYIRKRILYSLKSKGYLKKSKAEQILGCSIEYFKEYIENKFQNGMTWGNQGEWHLDHIKPISLAKDEIELLELNHYSNFQPLWAHDNLSKGNKFES
jgi:hypothetical protein